MKQRPSIPFADDSSLNTPFHQEAERIHACGLRPERISAVPRCAEGMSLPAWRTLVVAMNNALQTRALLARFSGDHFRAVSPDGAVMVLRLDNIAARCRARSLDAIAAEVRDHVEKVLTLSPVLASKSPPPFDEVAPRLIAQVYRADMAPPGPGHALVRPLGDGLVTILALDLGPAIVTVAPAWCDEWGQPEDALFRRGVENLRRRAVRRERLPCKVAGFLLSAEDVCLAGQIHHLARHIGRVPRAGALVALPTRSLMLCVPLNVEGRDRRLELVRETTSILRDLLVGLERLMPDRPVFSRDLYWWRDGVMKRFAVVEHRGDAFILPPKGFDEAAEELDPRLAN